MNARIISLIIAAAYLAVSGFAGGGENIFNTLIFLPLPLACIWFPNELGSFTGVIRCQYVNAQSPGCLVAFCGWLLLSLPFLIATISAVYS